METECSEQRFSCKPLGRREVVPRFGGGSVLLRELEAKLGIIRRFAACFTDHHDAERIEHTVEELVAQRVYGLALGYEVGTAGRLERSLLILAFAYLLLLVIGLVSRDTMSYTHWASATSKSRDQACGFTVGRYVLDRARWRLSALLEASSRMLTEWVEANRG